MAGQHAAYEAVPVEGMEELWFRSMEDLERCFASEEFAAAQELAKGFAGPVSTYLFETAKYPVPASSKKNKESGKTAGVGRCGGFCCLARFVTGLQRTGHCCAF